MKKKIRLFQKVVILLICFAIILKIFTIILSKYQSVANSNANIDIAFYLLKEDYKEMKLNLSEIFPQNDVFTYKFSVGNQEGDRVAEVDIEYELSIIATTNLPLTYELYKDQEYTQPGAINILKTNEIQKDEDGTYFRVMKTEKEELYFKSPKTNMYQLVVRFPVDYNSTDYQDILEILKIEVNGKQIT